VLRPISLDSSPGGIWEELINRAQPLLSREAGKEAGHAAVEQNGVLEETGPVLDGRFDRGKGSEKKRTRREINCFLDGETKKIQVRRGSAQKIRELGVTQTEREVPPLRILKKKKNRGGVIKERGRNMGGTQKDRRRLKRKRREEEGPKNNPGFN